MAEREAVRALREQLNEAWEVNSRLLTRIEELQDRLDRSSGGKGTKSASRRRVAERVRKEPAYTEEQYFEGTRIFRWPTNPALEVLPGSRSSFIDSGPSFDDTAQSYNDTVPTTAGDAFDQQTELVTPVKTVFVRKFQSRPNSGRNVLIPSPRPVPPVKLRDKSAVIDAEPAEAEVEALDEAVSSDSDRGSLVQTLKAATSAKKPGPKPEMLHFVDSSFASESDRSGSRPRRQQNTIARPPETPATSRARVEKTNTSVRFSVKASPRPISRRRVLAKVALPDESTNATLNESGVISDSPARTKRQTFRV